MKKGVKITLGIILVNVAMWYVSTNSKIAKGFIEHRDVFREESDMKDIQNIVMKYEVVYSDDEGIGNDRYDIYHFEISSKGLGEFQQVDYTYELLYKDNDGLLYKVTSKELVDSIRTLKHSQNLRYKVVRDTGTTKLFLVDQDTMQGYLIVSVI